MRDGEEEQIPERDAMEELFESDENEGRREKERERESQSIAGGFWF